MSRPCARESYRPPTGRRQRHNSGTSAPILDKKLSDFRMAYRDAKQAARAMEWGPSATAEKQAFGSKESGDLIEELIAFRGSRRRTG